MESSGKKLAELIEDGCNAVLLNLLWLVCCFPVITIGASTAAMQSVARRIACRESVHVWSQFWQGFRENWKQGSGVFALFTVFGSACAGDIALGLYNEGTAGHMCLFIGVVGLICIAAIWTMAFPLMIRYRTPFGKLLKNAFLLALTNPHIVLAGVAAAALFPAVGFVENVRIRMIAIPGFFLLGGVLPALAVQLLMRRVYERLESDTNREEA